MHKYFKLALRYYSGGRPSFKAAPTSAIHEHVWSRLDEHGDMTAVSCQESGRSLNYRRLRELSGNMGAWLNANTPRGMQVATILPNSLEMAISVLGSFEAGVPISPMNPESTWEEIATVLKHNQPKWIVTSSSKIHDVLEAMKAENRDISQIGIISIDNEILFSGVKFFDELLCESGRFERYENQPAIVITESGKTSKVSQENLLANCLQISDPNFCPIEPGDKIAALLPMFHYYGLTHTLLRGLSNGAEVVSVSSSKPNHLMATLNKSKVKVLPTISTMADVIASFGQEALSGLKSITVTGRPGVGSKKLKNVFRGEVLHTYGPVQGPILFQQRRGVGGRVSSVGEPLPGSAAKILAPGGAELPHMTEGEIWVRGPQLGDGKQWVRTGDMGYVDTDGWFYVTSEGEMSVDGLKVVPEEMDAVLQMHEGVSRAAVFSGERGLVAAVVPNDPFNPPTLRELSLHLQAKLSPHKRISDLVVMNTLPKNSVGEVDRNILSENYTSSREYVAFNYV